MVVSLKSLMDNKITAMETDEQKIVVFVRNPILHYTWDNGHYTSYAIHIETNHFVFALDRSVVRRRYSEFAYLRNLIKVQHPTIVPPNLPPKSFFATHSDVFIEQRKLGLEVFLQKLMEIPMYVSNRTVHLFVQSSQPMHKIAHMVGCSKGNSDVIEPHLSLNLICPDEESMMHSYNTDVPDFDILGRLQQNHNHGFGHYYETSTSSALCCHCGLPRNHSRVFHGASISYSSPSLRVPGAQYCEGHTNGGSYDSESDSTTTTASPSNNTRALVFNSHSESSLASESSKMMRSNIPLPKKKVSFSSEIIVAQILSHDDD